ncbi:MAG: DUF4215 domain-containing protein [Proteobacteria bacterium]|nr:DUF4215 domain-containing protein [Pseudomonadota bacterium]
MRISSFSLALAIALGLGVWGCESSDDGSLLPGHNANNQTASTDDSNPSPPNGTDNNSPGFPTGTDNRPVDISPTCGDGLLDEDEACDDGNNADGDGCSADCKVVEEGYSCVPPGMPCHRIAKCGDGNVAIPEQCDDGNDIDGDGCSSRCQIELGWKCEGSPSVCSPTVCGDGKIEGAETCDDGNTIPFDGCSENCQAEPDCSSGACTSICGDGIVLPPEECDDGNNIDGDGCSSDCKIEPGFTCRQQGCEGPDCTLEVSVIYRDFPHNYNSGGDFGLPPYPDTTCDTPSGATGMVQTRLDATTWKPVHANPPPNACARNINTWFANDQASLVVVDKIILYPDGYGNFVNRYGPNGEKWSDNNGNLYDGNPLFFPLDGYNTNDSGSRSQAKIPEQYGFDGWPWESDVPGMSATMHNFYFTSEVTFWFAYDQNITSTLNFTGDDDVWVFVNGQLAVDLGGVHAPLNGSVTISATNNFGMEHGHVYRINIFHAERKVEGSSFKLTLGGFDTTRSICEPTCGDGIVSLGEECDDGINEGGYGKCGPGCKLDAYCGDGIVQEEYEDCDDGNFDNYDECPNSCRIIIIG